MNKIKIFRFSTFIFILLFSFPLLRGYVLIRDYLFLLTYPLICLFLFPKAFFNKSVLCLFIYLLLILMFYSDHEKYDFVYTFSEFLSFLSVITIINVCIQNKDFKSLYVIFRFSLIILIITLLLSIPVLIKNPEIIRDMVMFNLTEDTSQFQVFQRTGIVSYGTIHSLPFLFPIFIYHLKNNSNKILKTFILLLFGLSLFVIINAATTTPVILSIMGILLGLLIQKSNKKNLVIIFFISLLYFLVSSKEILLSILDEVYPFFAENSIGGKILDFQTLIKFGQVSGEIEGREDLYNLSWQTFYENPFIGSPFFKDAGGHAYFVDKLAYLGLIGTIPLFLFFYFQLKLIYLQLIPKVQFYYLTGIILFVFLSFSKNIGDFDYWLFLFILLPCFSLFNFELVFKKNSNLIN